eukprot:GHVP01013358.1.p1 GENE.GHVP01013358.1~~GHVP01013358.1.p1  ORF type:complete len:113 (-),score=18.45 GHVP01013358.1:49-387(-)
MKRQADQSEIQEFFNEHFQKAYNEVFEATEDSESSATSGEWSVSKIDWKDENDLWCVYPDFEPEQSLSDQTDQRTETTARKNVFTAASVTPQTTKKQVARKQVTSCSPCVIL